MSSTVKPNNARGEPQRSRPNDEFLSQTEALKWLGGIDRSTLLRWRRTGIGPVPVMLGPRKLGYQLGELRRFAAARKGAMRNV